MNAVSPILAQAHPERQYLDLLAEVMAQGARRQDRTGTGTLGVFGRQIRFDLSQGFPLLTTKKLHLKSIVLELLWFLRGDTNIRWLQERGVSIWNEWADADGELGPVYGKQWRSWAAPDGRSIDQISNLVRGSEAKSLQSASHRLGLEPCGRGRHGPAALPLPVPVLRRADAQGVERLSCQLYQRSADLFLGVPFNIASYALLTMMMAQVTGFAPGEFVHTFGDAHLYLNHVEQAKTQLEREPRAFPTLKIAAKTDLFAFEEADFALEGYDPHPHIKAPVAV